MTGGFLLAEPPPEDGDAFDLDIPEAAPVQARKQLQKLTLTQEHRLIEFLDERFLQLSRGISRRHIQDSPLSTLPAFLKACQLLLHMILPIPPYATNQLRAEHMLRLTSTCDDVVGYDLSSRPAKQALFGFLNELDQGWETVLKAREWPYFQNEISLLSQQVSMTQKTRLLSMCQHLKTILTNAIQTGPVLEVADEDSDLESDDGDAESHVESVLHVELDVRRIFSRTLSILAGTGPV